jgi:hypothetical protein
VKFASVALVAVALLAGCGSDDDEGSDASTGTVPTTAPMAWAGPPQPAEDGTISVAGFNEYAQQELPESKRVPRELALEFLQVESPPYDLVEATRPGGTTVTVQRDNLEDDSVRAQRYTLEFALFSGGVVNLSSARVDYQCQPNRGHQNFSPELCL